MNQENLQTGRQEAIQGFDIEGIFLECTPCGNGHINDTFMMSLETGKHIGILCST